MAEEVNLNSCLMWNIGLYTPVDLFPMFNVEDLKGTGVELESHITVLYAKEVEISSEKLKADVERFLDTEIDGNSIQDMIKTTNYIKVLDLFQLSKFENESDILILKLKTDNKWFDELFKFNKRLVNKYNITPTFNQYTPHITLAELEKGKSSKYLNSRNFLAVLNDSYIDFEDFIVSYGFTNADDRRQKYLTHEKCVDRYFRIREAERRMKEEEKGE